jgi:predicted nucleotidyltransferase
MAGSDLTKEDIISLLRQSKTKLSSLGVKSIGLFGSFVRGDSSAQSDIDILVEFNSDKMTYDNFMDTCFFLEELFDHQVEVVTVDSISPYIKPYVMKEVEYVTLSS